MRLPAVFALGGLIAAILPLSACLVGIGDWERFSKDFHWNYAMKPGGRLSVETFNGEVDISGWDQDAVDISGTKYGPSQEEADDLKIDVDHAPDSVAIRVPRPGMRRNNQGARLAIKVPRTTEIERVTTSNGQIRTTDGAGPSHLRTSNGSIHVMDLRGDLEAETTNSAIELAGVAGDVRARTSNGRIRAERVEGALEAYTTNASVNADIRRPDKAVHVETSNNGVELTLPEKFSSSLHVSTRNAPITLRLAEGTNARISAQTSNSSIETEFEVRAQGELGKNKLEGVIGSGGPLMELETSNGGIHLLKR